ncbi:lysophospholipid acyltransferase family protein [Domibacillus epiphyticus]|uniref:1-acyl-sn-glycerol-3-phosphate acyltransferase n=1 Tax=Domibacillus epiphyticus TaxID=1714355 RepID=A0A1V2A3U1_9BACI|nr:lysophospholipid acyltransferase family protein [Domibacillus epiphyticus]OMP65673.1 1-acyl-sn-glycerol-3-phosphate acyltransferase [Domibacillus epiphyticus]
MIRLLFFFLYLFISLTALIPVMLRNKNIDPELPAEERDRIVHPAVKKWNRSVIKMAGATVCVSGEEHVPDGPVMLVSNHEGDFDVPAMLGYLDKPFGFVAKTEMKKIPLLSTWMSLIHCLFINRNDRRDAVKMLRDGAAILEKGHSLFIFPEGTRNKGGELKPFKTGAFRMAKDAGVPIVPVAIKGSADVFEKNGRKKLTASRIDVAVLPPLMPADYIQSDLKRKAAEVKETIEKQLVKMS